MSDHFWLSDEQYRRLAPPLPSDSRPPNQIRIMPPSPLAPRSAKVMEPGVTAHSADQKGRLLYTRVPQ